MTCYSRRRVPFLLLLTFLLWGALTTRGRLSGVCAQVWSAVLGLP